MKTNMMKSDEQLWKEFKTENDEQARQELVSRYLPLVKYHSDRVTQHLPPEVRTNEREDIYIEAIIGLMDAMERFDPSRNIKFQTFASKRVRGAILDYLRRHDIVPKSVRDNANRIEKAISGLSVKLGRMPKDSEIIKELGMTEDSFYDIMQKVNGTTVLSFDMPFLVADGGKWRLEEVIGEPGEYIAEFEKNEAIRRLGEIIQALDNQERLLLELYYWDGLTLKEAGIVLGISESRACQIHAKTVLKIRSGLRKSDKER